MDTLSVIPSHGCHLEGHQKLLMINIHFLEKNIFCKLCYIKNRADAQAVWKAVVFSVDINSAVPSYGCHREGHLHTTISNVSLSICFYPENGFVYILNLKFVLHAVFGFISHNGDGGLPLLSYNAKMLWVEWQVRTDFKFRLNHFHKLSVFNSQTFLSTDNWRP